MSRRAPQVGAPAARPGHSPSDRPDAVPSASSWERLTALLAREGNRERLCEEVCRVVVEELGFSRALIATLDRKRERLVTRAGYDPSIGVHVARALRRLFTIPLAPLPDGRVLVAAWCVLRGEQVHVPDASAYAFRPEETVQRRQMVRAFGVKEYVLTPIHGRREPIGLLGADRRNREGIGPEDLRHLRIVASVVGLALETPLPPSPPSPLADEASGEPDRAPRRARPDQVRQMQAVLDALHEGLLVLGGEGTVRYLNRAASGLLGVLPWEAVGKSWREVLHLVNPDGFARLLEERPAVLPDRLKRWTLYAPGGPPLVVDVEILPLDSAHVGAGTALFLEDITDRAEEERVRDEFVSMLVHDLNAPLGNVLGFAELLLMGRAGELNPTQRNFVSRIEASGRLMTQLVEDILELGELESGRAPLERRPLDAHALVQEALDPLAGLAERSSVALLNDVPQGLPRLHGDRVRLLQAFQNVVTNAIEASGDGQTVRVQGEVFLREGGPWLRLRVVDEGVGLDEQVAVHLFDKYRSFGRGKRRRRRGRGLGLPIARLIVEAHGGEIAAAGVPGRGTTVTVDLPLRAEDA